MVRIKREEEERRLSLHDVPESSQGTEKTEDIKPIKEEYKPFTLSPESVLRRLELLNQKPIVIENLEPEYIARTTSRVHFLSKRYGGNQQEATPRPAQRFIDVHGIPQFCFLQPKWSPNAPTKPGQPGLSFTNIPECFSTNPTLKGIPAWLWKGPDKWQYLGHYRLVESERLSVDEWLSQDAVVRETWIANYLTKDWLARRDTDRRVDYLVKRRCAEYLLKRELHQAGANRQVTDPEVDEYIVNNRYKEVTHEMLEEDLASGFQWVPVCAMECYGYDERFQRELIEAYSQPKETWPLFPKQVKKEDSEDDVKQEDEQRQPKIRKRPPGYRPAPDLPSKRPRLIVDFVDIVVPRSLASRREKRKESQVARVAVEEV